MGLEAALVAVEEEEPLEKSWSRFSARLFRSWEALDAHTRIDRRVRILARACCCWSSLLGVVDDVSADEGDAMADDSLILNRFERLTRGGER